MTKSESTQLSSANDLHLGIANENQSKFNFDDDHKMRFWNGSQNGKSLSSRKENKQSELIEKSQLLESLTSTNSTFSVASYESKSFESPKRMVHRKSKPGKKMLNTKLKKSASLGADCRSHKEISRKDSPSLKRLFHSPLFKSFRDNESKLKRSNSEPTKRFETNTSLAIDKSCLGLNRMYLENYEQNNYNGAVKRGRRGAVISLEINQSVSTVKSFNDADTFSQFIFVPPAKAFSSYEV